MKIGYARVSTDEQILDLQLDALKAAGCEKIYQDVGISGVCRKRPGLDECLSSLSKGDIFTVWKIDRAFRSLKHALDVLEEFETRGIHFCELTHNIDTTTAMGRAFFQIRAVFAELERGLISDRTKAGMEAARKRGKHIGRPRKLKPEQVEAARELIASDKATISGLAESPLNVSPATLSRALKRTSQS